MLGGICLKREGINYTESLTWHLLWKVKKISDLTTVLYNECINSVWGCLISHSAKKLFKKCTNTGGAKRDRTIKDLNEGRDKRHNKIIVVHCHYWDNCEYSHMNDLKKMSSLLTYSHILVSWFMLNWRFLFDLIRTVTPYDLWYDILI